MFEDQRRNCLAFLLIYEIQLTFSTYYDIINANYIRIVFVMDACIKERLIFLL